MSCMVGRTFKYDDQVWLVVGKPVIFPGYYKCMSPKSEVKYINVTEVINAN